MKKRIDKETQKVIADGEKLKGLVEHSGWSIARSKLISKVAQYLSINDVNIQQADVNTLMTVIASRKLIAQGLLDFLHEIEGEVEQYKGNVPLVESYIEEHILRINN